MPEWPESLPGSSSRGHGFRPRPLRRWDLRERSVELGATTCVMAILNLTPDSFHPASRLASTDDALHAAEAAMKAGADIVDIGAESTRPGATPVADIEELKRLLPALDAIRRRFDSTPLSIDTRHAAVARAALEHGADIINDVSGLRDEDMGGVMADAQCGVVLMHVRGDFATMHRQPPLDDPVGVVKVGLQKLLERAASSGIAETRIILDPGFGFGKNLDENFPLLSHFDEFHEFGVGLLAGLSRKKFIGHALGGVPSEGRLSGTLAAVCTAILAGAHVVRVHDVAETRDVAAIADRVLQSHS